MHIFSLILWYPGCGRATYAPVLQISVGIIVSGKLRKVAIRKFIILYFRNKRHHRTGNFEKHLFLGHLQPPVENNLEDLAYLVISL